MLCCVCRCVMCCVCAVRCGTLKTSRVYSQNVPVCAGNTRTCFSPCARGAGIHGDVLNGHTEGRAVSSSVLLTKIYSRWLKHFFKKNHNLFSLLFHLVSCLFFFIVSLLFSFIFSPFFFISSLLLSFFFSLLVLSFLVLSCLSSSVFSSLSLCLVS